MSFDKKIHLLAHKKRLCRCDHLINHLKNSRVYPLTRIPCERAFRDHQWLKPDKLKIEPFVRIAARSGRGSGTGSKPRYVKLIHIRPDVQGLGATEQKTRFSGATRVKEFPWPHPGLQNGPILWGADRAAINLRFDRSDLCTVKAHRGQGGI